MLVQKLENIEFDIIVDCFLKSFANYFVDIPSDKNYYKERWKIAKVNYGLSYGMFDGEKLVGFILNAIDERNCVKIAFNTGTGVLPEYRGKRIVKSIYDYAIPDLKNNGVSKCSLEVIIENTKAVNIYKRIGFDICKTFNCFSGDIKPNLKEKVVIQRVSYNEFDWNDLPNQDVYSWDFHSRVIKNGDYRYYQISKGNFVESYFVINPNNGYVAQFEVLLESQGCWDRLFSGIREISNSIKVINVDTRLDKKIGYLNSIGLENTVNQYEMEMSI